MTPTPTKGVVVELPPHVAQELRQRQHPLLSDEWNQVIAGNIVPAEAVVGDEPFPDDGDDAAADDDDDAEQPQNDDDTLSYTPPSSLPQLFLSLDRLVGYTPTEQEEIDALTEQVRNALFEDDRQDDDHIQKLFDAGVALHGDNSQETQQYVRLDYPEHLVDTNGRVVTTARLWKRLLLQRNNSSGGIPSKLWNALQNCQRTLLWKDAMRKELLQLARDEEEASMNRTRMHEMQVWKDTRRNAKLQELYAVRETFVHRLEQAEEKWEQLQNVRDLRVSEELQRRGLEIEPQRVDFADLFGLQDDDDDDEYYDDGDFNLLSDQGSDNQSEYSDESQEELESELDSSELPTVAESPEEEGNAVVEANETNEPRVKQLATNAAAESSILPTEADIADYSAQENTQRNETNEIVSVPTATAEEEEEEIADHRAKVMDQVREMYTTTELKLAMAAVTGLKDRLERVDELLETIQEEEWADEEDNEEDQTDPMLVPSAAEPQSGPDLGLLDQILAMVLGSTPPKEGIPVEDHVKWLEGEHLAIVVEWKAHFGRLPPSSNSANKQAATADSSQHLKVTKESVKNRVVDVKVQREVLGIPENYESNWDDEDDEDDDTEKSNNKPQAAPPKIGLRPGGRIG